MNEDESGKETVVASNVQKHMYISNFVTIGTSTRDSRMFRGIPGQNRESEEGDEGRNRESEEGDEGQSRKR